MFQRQPDSARRARRRACRSARCRCVFVHSTTSYRSRRSARNPPRARDQLSSPTTNGRTEAIAGLPCNTGADDGECEIVPAAVGESCLERLQRACAVQDVTDMRVTDDQTPSPCRRIARRFADGGPRQAAQRGSHGFGRDGQPVVAPFSKCVSGHLHIESASWRHYRQRQWRRASALR